MKIEWAAPQNVASAFTDDQKVRVQALRVATEIAILIDENERWEADDTVAFLLTVGAWIIDPSEVSEDIIENGLALMLANENQQGEQG